MDDLVSRNKVLEAIRNGTTHDDIRARIEIMEPVPAIPLSAIDDIQSKIIKEGHGFSRSNIAVGKVLNIIDIVIQDYTE